MALVGKPVSSAVSSELVARVAPNQETGIANAVHAEAVLGNVGHGIALGLFREPPACLIACEQKQMILEEYAPSRVADLGFTEF